MILITIDRSRIRKLIDREKKKFIEAHPESRKLFERARKSLIAGVPMNWMIRWAGPFPIFAAEAKGAYITDIDGHRYLDLCLGDTGSMFGHSPKAVIDAVTTQVTKGITMMLPSEDSVWVGEELARRFGLPYWQISMTATDANRFSIRLAREITGRKKILVFNGCYHGSVDEALVWCEDGVTVPGPANIGPAVNPAITTQVIEFNDIDALEKALSTEDIACILCEPAMTNCGIILPEAGYHDALREMTKRFDTLLIIDETHTICTGPGGYTGEFKLQPDIITIGKPIAGGVPAAAYGISQEVADKIQAHIARIMEENASDSGIGGTLSGNVLATAAMRATLEQVITKEAYDRMIPLAVRFTEGVDKIIKAEELPWHVIRLGARAEYSFMPTPPHNGTEAEAGEDSELDRLMHLMTLNRGILLTPFHNMALISPETTAEDIDFHTKVFAECVRELIG